jgi:hypothetical protein
VLGQHVLTDFSPKAYHTARAFSHRLQGFGAVKIWVQGLGLNWQRVSNGFRVQGSGLVSEGLGLRA